MKGSRHEALLHHEDHASFLSIRRPYDEIRCSIKRKIDVQFVGMPNRTEYGRFCWRRTLAMERVAREGDGAREPSTGNRRERCRQSGHRVLTNRSQMRGDWDGSGCCKSVVPQSANTNRFLRGEDGWDARVRTWEWRNQNPLPYHLATSHHAVWKTGARATAERHHNQSSQGRQWCVAKRHQRPVEC